MTVSSVKENMQGSASYLHRANVYRAINEIVPDLDFWMLGEYFSWNADV